jgi:hypothetical protein
MVLSVGFIFVNQTPALSYVLLMNAVLAAMLVLTPCSSKIVPKRLDIPKQLAPVDVSPAPYPLRTRFHCLLPILVVLMNCHLLVGWAQQLVALGNIC